MSLKESADFTIANAFNGIEVVNANYTKQNFSKHVHEGYTIGVIEYGAQRFFRSGASHVAGQSSIILVNADDVHTGQSAAENGWGYKAMYPTPEHFSQISTDLYHGKNLAPYFQSSVINDPYLADQLRLIFAQLEENGSQLLMETLFYSALMSLTLRHSSFLDLPKETSGSRSKLLLAKEFLDSYPEEDISLIKLAEVADLSQFHFIRQFKKHFNLSPHAYQIQVRLKKAKALLKLGVKPSQVSTDCGFYDQSHFTHHFKKALGTTPSRFQKQARIYNTLS
ncbi:AraC family transcriptional regulator [Psychromonas algicola]|uniref:AraC family transcriptional regulator n=1 Tax=Psychromonas algicola TaxID=2555642 RepID=UPI0010676731|nr:AraC family transcriptional regulator [Psychromonas sp. RZ5]TEW52350.1 AraC family transcriptional regulator [Psychromonas sp. RZ5]